VWGGFALPDVPRLYDAGCEDGLDCTDLKSHPGFKSPIRAGTSRLVWGGFALPGVPRLYDAGCEDGLDCTDLKSH
jgi:hypothetical protein